MIPLTRSVQIANAVMAVPLFAVLSVFSLLTPESVLLWQFVLALVMSQVMMKMPQIYIDAVGGREKLVNDIQTYGGAPLKLYGNPPMCCVCKAPKQPELVDIWKLKFGILQFCAIQPILAFIELFLSIENTDHVAWAEDFGWRTSVFTWVKLLSNFQAMSSCTGLATLCEMADLKDNVEEGSLNEKRVFVQSFLWGLGLIPNLCHGLLTRFLHGATLHNGVKMEGKDQTIWAVSAVTCIATLYIVKASKKAFPVDDQTLYPTNFYQPLL